MRTTHTLNSKNTRAVLLATTALILAGLAFAFAPLQHVAAARRALAARANASPTANKILSIAPAPVRSAIKKRLGLATPSATSTTAPTAAMMTPYTITKSASPASGTAVGPGQIITYTISVTNGATADTTAGNGFIRMFDTSTTETSFQFNPAFPTGVMTQPGAGSAWGPCTITPNGNGTNQFTCYAGDGIGGGADTFAANQTVVFKVDALVSNTPTIGSVKNNTSFFEKDADGNGVDEVFIGSNTVTHTIIAPPTISKAFGTSSLPLNGTTNLTFNVTNPSTTLPQSGIAFNDTLPAGLVVATPNNLIGSCGGGTITATAGSNEINLSGATLASSTSCNFSVNVTATSFGAKNNITSNVTTGNGVKGNAAIATLFVAFNQPTIYSSRLSDPLTCVGPGNVITGVIQLNNPNAGALPFTLNTIFTNLAGVPGSCSLTGAAPGATCTVTSGGLIASGTLSVNATLTAQYRAQVADGLEGATLTASSSATLGGTTVFPDPLVAVQTITCPALGFGAVFPSAAQLSDQKAGSVLFYNLYTSSASNSNMQNTRINLTNIHGVLSTAVHLFFIDGGTCSVADSYVCLTPLQTASFLGSDIDPGVNGYVVAVATDSNGCPRDFNYLIGDEYVKMSTGHVANLGAVAFTALPGGLSACTSLAPAVLKFDGVSYNLAPRVLAVDNVPSRTNGNDTLLVLNRFGGDLSTGASTLGTIFGVMYDDTETALSFSMTGGCQLRSSLSNSFPRTAPRFENFIQAGHSGWMKLNMQSDIAILGAVINFNTNAGTQANAFNQGHNLHTLTLTTTQLTIPVFPPGC